MLKYIKFVFLIAAPMALMFSSCTCPCDKVVAGPDDIVAEAMEGLEVMKTDQLKTMMDSLELFYLFDVREMDEYAYGFIPGAINIPAGVLIFRMDNEAFWDNEMIYPPEKTDKIIVYCKKGNRSVIAAKYLERLGYTNVSFLDGGWKAWEIAYPLLYEENLDALGGNHNDHAEVGGC